MRHGSLFSGIGGFDLAAQWMGWENVFHCEWNPFCQKVLKHHFPESLSYSDITKTDFTKHKNAIDIISGGFPCQPFSIAGKRKGTEDNRYLWPEMLRAIREISPAYIVGENVSGLVNWDRGLVFDKVQADMESEGYEVTPFLLPACGLNAPHRRERVWFVAHSNAAGQWRDRRTGFEDGNIQRAITHTASIRQSGQGQFSRPINTAENKVGEANRLNRTNEIGKQWNQFPTQPPVCGRDDGVPNRVDRIKALGNAIVPQVAFEIFKAIEAVEK